MVDLHDRHSRTEFDEALEMASAMSEQIGQQWENAAEWLREPPREDPEIESFTESALLTASAVAAGLATRHLMKSAYQKWRGMEPPENPAAEGVAWREAIVWAATIGAAVGVSRVFSRRGVSAAVRRVKR